MGNGEFCVVSSVSLYFATKAHLSYAVLTAGASGVVVEDAGATKPIGEDRDVGGLSRRANGGATTVDLPRSGDGNDRCKYTTINHHQLVTHVQIHSNQPSPISNSRVFLADALRSRPAPVNYAGSCPLDNKVTCILRDPQNYFTVTTVHVR